jgi:hypothetical protein
MTELKAIIGKPGKIRTANVIGGTESVGCEIVPRAIGPCLKLHSLLHGCGNCQLSIILSRATEVNAELGRII